MNRINFFKNKNDCNDDSHQPKGCHKYNYLSNDCCDKKDVCSCCVKCPPGSPGQRGSQGSASPQGPIGETGPAGPQGPAGVLNYADFYAIMPPDNSATVAPGTDVSFPLAGGTRPVSAHLVITQIG